MQVATIPLEGLLDAASQPDADFEVVAVVSQPPRASGRGRKAPKPSPVHQLALDRGLPESAILTPVKAREVDPPSEIVKAVSVGHSPFLQHPHVADRALCNSQWLSAGKITAVTSATC